MLQKGEIKTRNSMYFMTGRTLNVLEPKAGRLVSVIFSVPCVDGKLDSDHRIAKLFAITIPTFVSLINSVISCSDDYTVDPRYLEVQGTLKYFEISVPRYIVCVEVLRPSQPNGVMSIAVSLPNHTFTGQA